MKSSKLIAAGVLLASMSGIAMPGLAGEDHKGCTKGIHHPGAWGAHEGFDGRALKHIGETLELTDTQKETLKGQREANKAAREALRSKLFEAREALTSAASSGANHAELNALAETLGKLQAEQALAGAKAQKAFLAVLTEEQKQTLAELKHKRMERRENRKEVRKSVDS